MHTAIAPAAPQFPFEAVSPRFTSASEVDATPSMRRTNRSASCFAGPRMINSVVNDAGLGRFVYLLGKSGKRYVFSSITAEQATLYDKAVFASSKAGSDAVTVSPCANDTLNKGHVLYVHLLDSNQEERNTVIADLEMMTAQ